jgi:hypothetical protein
MQNLDLWLQYIDTNEVIPLFERNAREYSIPKLSEVNWSEEPEYLVQIAKEKNFSTFEAMKSEEQYRHIFSWLLERGERDILLQCFKHLLPQSGESVSDSTGSPIVVQRMLDFLRDAPFLSVAFARVGHWAALPRDVCDLLERGGSSILQAHILSANEMQEFVVEPFKRVMSQIQNMSMTDFAGLVELISLVVRSVDIALDLLLECLEPESGRVLPGDPKLVQHFVRNILGIALDHIDEAAQPQVPKKDLLELKFSHGNSEGFAVVESRLRIDAPMGTLATADHVRLTTATPPTNSVTARICSIDGLVESSQPGLVTFRCFHPIPPYVEKCSWELQNCGSFVTSKTMFDAVHTLATQQDSCRISDQILGMQDGISSGSISWPTRHVSIGSLNSSQNAAVAASLSYPLTCLWGPPGTGKTYTIVEIIKQLQASPANGRILVTAPTHNAVDNVMRKYLANVISGGMLDTAEPIALRVSTDVSSNLIPPHIPF